MTDEYDSNCELCREVELAGIAATGSLRPEVGGGPFSRLVQRTAIVDVLSGIGCLAPGYVLLVPRRHVRSTGELSTTELRHTFETAWAVAERIRRTFGGFVVLAEHGSSGDRNLPGSACVAHSHLHLFPVGAGLDPSAFVLPHSKLVRGFGALSLAASEGRNYYYCSWEEAEGFFCVEPSGGSQKARRVWAQLLGHPDKWDWAAFPDFDKCRLTASVLREDEVFVQEVRALSISRSLALSETLQAYNCAAEWYIKLTKTFPPQSSLREDMKTIASRTTGWVLDAGAGAGRDAGYFASLGRNVVAFDAAIGLVSRIPAGNGVFPVLGDVRALPIQEHSIGAVWCSAVLLHLASDDALQSLREFWRVLRPGGLTQIAVKEGRGHVSEPVPGNPALRRHFFLYESADLELLACKAGFEIAEKWTGNEPDSAKTEQRWVKLVLRKPTA